MADVEIIDGLLNAGKLFSYTTTGGDERTLEYDGKDEKIVVLINNSEANDCDVLFKAGDLFQKEMGDITVTVDGNTSVFVTFDSARVKDNDGEISIELKQKGTDDDFDDGDGSSAEIGIAVLEIA